MMGDKIVATNLNGDVMIFDSKEQYDEYRAKVFADMLNNGFTTRYDKVTPTP